MLIAIIACGSIGNYTIVFSTIKESFFYCIFLALGLFFRSNYFNISDYSPYKINFIWNLINLILYAVNCTLKSFTLAIMYYHYDKDTAYNN